MKPLAQMQVPLPLVLPSGDRVVTTDAWAMLMASRGGDLDRVRELVAATPALAALKYDYTAPLHLAVLGGHTAVVEFLLREGGIDPTYKTHPYMDPLPLAARERGFDAVAAMLDSAIADPSRHRDWGENGRIDHCFSDVEKAFERAVDENRHADVAAHLRERPELALNPLFFWGEGILSMPVKEGDFAMCELLMQHGARVPDLSKWGKEFYFKRTDGAAFLLERGMNPNHMTWRGVTLLHDMAWTGQIDKAALLLDHGAAIEASDDEYCTTPLGFAARWGQKAMVAFLLDRGADPAILSA